MTDESQAQDNVSAAELEIQQILKDGFAKWRAARQQANPYGYITVSDEADMRRHVSEWERVRKGLPLDAIKQQPSDSEWELRTFLDAQQSQLKEPPWKIKGLVVAGGANLASRGFRFVHQLGGLVLEFEMGLVLVHRDPRAAVFQPGD